VIILIRVNKKCLRISDISEISEISEILKCFAWNYSVVFGKDLEKTLFDSRELTKLLTTIRILRNKKFLLLKNIILMKNYILLTGNYLISVNYFCRF